MAVERLFGDLPQGWTYLTLGEVCEQGGGGIQTGPFGSQLHKADYVPVGIPSIMPQNIGENRVIEDAIARITLDDAKRLSRYRVRTGDIVYSRRGDVEKRALIREAESGWLCGTGCLRVRLGEHGPDPSYAAFYLGHPLVREWVTRHAHGATMPNLNTAILSACPFVLPPVIEQQAIAYMLSALDDKIDLNRRTNETLEEMAGALFKDWFVDFGPTMAKMEGREPYLEPELWAQFPERLDEDGKPEGWATVPLSEYMSFRGGSQPPARDFVDEMRPGYVRLLQIRDFDSNAHVTYIPKTSKLRLVNEDDICIGRYGSGSGEVKDSLGRLCRGLEGAINVALIRVEPLFNCREWLATYIGSGRFRREISGGSARAVQAGFRKEDLAHVKVSRASEGVHDAFEEVGQMVWKKRKQSNEESRTLAQTRDLLLLKLMSGELRIQDAEALVSEVV